MHCIVWSVTVPLSPTVVGRKKERDRNDETYPEELRGGLVGAADLDLEVGGLGTAALGHRTVGARLGGVLPGIGTAKDVVPLAAREALAREDGRLDGVLVRAGPALEPVAARLHAREDEEVRTVRADFFIIR